MRGVRAAAPVRDPRRPITPAELDPRTRRLLETEGATETSRRDHGHSDRSRHRLGEWCRVPAHGRTPPPPRRIAAGRSAHPPDARELRPSADPPRVARDRLRGPTTP